MRIVGKGWKCLACSFFIVYKNVRKQGILQIKNMLAELAFILISPHPTTWESSEA
jgi:hypothetical protein